MSTNETKKPIGFEMELTEEQLKDVAGGAGNVIYKAVYKCLSCGATFTQTAVSRPDTIERPHNNSKGRPCRSTVNLYDWEIVY